MTLVLLRLVAIGSLLSSAAHAQAAVPRFSGPLPDSVVRHTRGMSYAPTDVPLRWLVSGEVIIAHREQYNSADVYSSTCEGSGLYSVSTNRPGIARPILLGSPACEVAVDWDGATVAPDGRWAVYAVRVPTNRSQLMRLNLVTGVAEPIRAGCAVYHRNPSISMDGRMIASDGLCRTGDSEYELYVSRIDGSGLRRIGGSDSTSRESPTWSPDGRQLAFQHTVPERAPSALGYEIAVIDTAGSAIRTIGEGVAPSWSPDGLWIAFLSPTADARSAFEIRVVRPNGTEAKVLFRNSTSSTYSRGWGPMLEGSAAGPLVWSPDGSRLAFARNFGRGTSVWTIHLGSGELRQLTVTGGGRAR